jgi:glycerate 2-kinase
MIAINNNGQLVTNGETQLNQKARILALKSLQSALNAVNPAKIVKSRILLKNSILKVNSFSFDMKKFKNVYVLGGGKASGSMAEALEQILSKYLTSGLINVPHSSKHQTKIIKLHKSGHPTPDEFGVEGASHMLQIAGQAKENDLVICLISGGGSSLMPLPRCEISIEDMRQVTEALLRCGATIDETNTVRKHISSFKGGWLAKKAHPATVLNLILSDVVGDPLDFIASGPTVPDSTTFGDAVKVLTKYGLWHKTPMAVKQVLSNGEKGAIPETPKANDEAFKKVHSVVVGNNRSATSAARESLDFAGLGTFLLTSVLEGEARQVGVMLASVAREIIASGNPVPKPAGVVAGGETTVTVAGRGLGGRNQEIALAAALKLKGVDGVVVASLSTDGVDGPTDAAGAIVDGRTIVRAAKMGLNPERFLAENDSYDFFSRLNDLILTGATGTNVNDVSVVVVL